MESTIDIRDQQGRQAKTPEELRQEVIGADWRPTMAEIVTVLEEDHNERFAAEVDLNGAPWAPLSPYTIERKGHDTKLQELGLLINSVTDSTSPLAIREFEDQGEEKSITFGTRRPWARSHQEGTEKIPQRKFLGASDKAKERIREIIGRRVQAIVMGGN